MTNLSIGFTGTRKGMTDTQKQTVHGLLNAWKGDYDNVTTHHGDCLGADAEFHEIARNLGLFVYIHPPTDDKLQAHCVGDYTYTPKHYLTRNAHIVDDSHVLVAAPASMRDITGGTWWTIRNARLKGREVHVIDPEGGILTTGPDQ